VRAGAVDVAGTPVAGAVLQYGGGIAELAGVWTHPDHRRRGHARVACHALLAEAFAAGLPLAWLSAAEGALRLYEGLGFVRVGTQVNLEAP
jgi:ribosomal protein S18 acetylase RimI-like enzyme